MAEQEEDHLYQEVTWSPEDHTYENVRRDIPKAPVSAYKPASLQVPIQPEHQGVPRRAPPPIPPRSRSLRSSTGEGTYSRMSETPDHGADSGIPIMPQSDVNANADVYEDLYETTRVVGEAAQSVTSLHRMSLESERSKDLDSHVYEEPTNLQSILRPRGPPPPPPKALGNRPGHRPTILVRPMTQTAEMTVVQKSVLNHCWNKIVDNVEAQVILDYMHEKQIFDTQTCDNLVEPRDARERNIKLMQQLVTRGSDVYMHFKNVLRLKYEFLHKEIEKMESCLDNEPHEFAYHEVPRERVSLQTTLSDLMRQVRPEERRHTQRNIEQLVQGSGYHGTAQSIGRRQGKVTQNWQLGGFKLKKGENVFLVSGDDDLRGSEISISTRAGLKKVPRNVIKILGDLSQERYHHSHEMLAMNEAEVFIKQTVEDSQRDGVFLVYKPRGGCGFQCEYHLCHGFFRGSTKHFHIRNMDGYFLREFVSEDDYIQALKDKQTKFANVTDLIEFHRVTSDKVLDGVLEWPMQDAESPLNPEPDFAASYRCLKETDYVMTNRILGKGYYGVIYKGNIRSPNIPVAIKTPNKVNQTVAKRDELYREAKILSMLSDENILKLIGVCFTNTVAHVLTELAGKGSLLNIVRQKKNKKDIKTEKKSFLRWAQQIASGMKHLEHKLIVHRDLALRNIFLFDDGNVKIGDFGQARRLYSPQHNYYVTKNDMLPKRWTAPEVLITLCHSLKADVWSYGVLLYELYSYGNKPYAEIANDDAILTNLVSRERLTSESGWLEQPSRCSEYMYNLMCSCWNLEVKKRPTFSSLHQSLMFAKEDFALPYDLPSLMENDHYDRVVKKDLSLDDYDTIVQTGGVTRTEQRPPAEHVYYNVKDPQSNPDDAYSYVRNENVEKCQ